jgi:hypothetical protein
MTTMPRAVSFADYRFRPATRLRRLPRSQSRRFGRRRPFIAAAEPAPSAQIGDNLRLFAATFAAGFLFVSVLIA